MKILVIDDERSIRNLMQEILEDEGHSVDVAEDGAKGVEMADKAGITAVVQPGGSIRDQLSIDYCNEHKISMVFTGTRHFKH